MSRSVPPPEKSAIKHPSKSMGFFANAMKRKHSFIQFFGVTAMFLLSIRSVGQKYQMKNLEEDTEALREENALLEKRMNHIKETLLAEAAADSSGASAARLRLLFAQE